MELPVSHPRREAARLLLIEPNRSAMGVMARRLNEAGYRVAAAESAEKGIAELYRLPVDLVLAELAMPGMSGTELTRMIRDDSSLRDVPVILIAGRSDSSGAIRALAAGADDIVAKPFDHDVLIARIERQLDRGQAMRELRADNASLDARVVRRAIELGEMRLALKDSEGALQRLSAMVGRN